MPLYCFKCECGNTDSKKSSMKNAPTAITCSACGKRMNRDFSAEHGRHKNTPGNWPMYSDAMGVHPDQRQQAIEEAAKMGIPTNFNELGQAEFRSPAHRKKYCEAFGVYDRNGGYSDPVPQRG